MTIASNKLTRFARGTKHSGRAVKGLSSANAAVIEGRTVFQKQVKPPVGTVLKSGHNSSKVGKFVTKGKWKGMPIFTLSLEERRTCPRSCKEWQICYGNHMPYAHRYEHGIHLERKLNWELHALQIAHPRGFVVRLHVLGDFYSIPYVHKWQQWLDEFPALRVFGYTARQKDTQIGYELYRMRTLHWDRFAVRQSGGGPADGPSARTIPGPLKMEDGIVCPAQTGQSLCCGTCTLCWSAPKKTILFMAH